MVFISKFPVVRIFLSDFGCMRQNIVNTQVEWPWGQLKHLQSLSWWFIITCFGTFILHWLFWFSKYLQLYWKRLPLVFFKLVFIFEKNHLGWKQLYFYLEVRGLPYFDRLRFSKCGITELITGHPCNHYFSDNFVELPVVSHQRTLGCMWWLLRTEMWQVWTCESCLCRMFTRRWLLLGKEQMCLQWGVYTYLRF